MNKKTEPTIKELQTALIIEKKFRKEAMLGWGRALKEWRYHYKFSILFNIIFFLLGMAAGIMLFSLPK